MNRHSQIYSLLLFFIFIISCNVPPKIDTHRTIPPKKQDTPQPTINLPEPVSEYDPYFTESEAISSSFGPTSITRNIMQDKKGNIWLATWLGIIQYDGETFTNFTNKEKLRRFRVFSLLEDSKGILWFGTIGAGVYKYDGKEFTNFTTKEGLVHNGIGCIYEDKAGNIWFGTQGGVSKYDGKTFSNFTTKDGLKDNDINAIVEDKNGRLWFATRGDACYYDSSFLNGQVKKFQPVKNNEGKLFTNVRSIIEDRKGNIWLGGNDGLWHYDNNSVASTQTAFTQLSTDFTGYIYEDKKGNIWTSSAANGNANNWTLSRYDSFGLELNGILPSTEIKTETGMFFGILEDATGGIWLGNLEGVYQYDGISFEDFKKKR